MYNHAGSGGAGSGAFGQDQKAMVTRSYSGPTAMVTRSYSGPTNLLPESSIMGPVLQMNSNMEANHQPALANGPENNLMLGGNTGLTGLALGPPQSDQSASSSGAGPLVPSLMNLPQGPVEWGQRSRSMRRQESIGRVVPPEEMVSEEEIRRQSLEFLENEDMHTQIQQLLRMFNGQGGDVPFSPYGAIGGEDGFPYGLPDDVNLEELKPRENHKAYVGWLKLKAALRWGIFIRKRAAARRAQQEEVDGE